MLDLARERNACTARDADAEPFFSPFVFTYYYFDSVFIRVTFDSVLPSQQQTHPPAQAQFVDHRDRADVELATSASLLGCGCRESDKELDVRVRPALISSSVGS